MNLVQDVRIGTPIDFDGVTLVPLFRDRGRVAPDYLPGPVAAGRGLLAIGERPVATVPELAVTNHGGLPVLLAAGELLLGAKQNRTLTASLLVPPLVEVPVPVSCVEAGRWQERGSATRSPRHAPHNVRAAAARGLADQVGRGAGRRSDQGEVWREVSRCVAAVGAQAPTQALEDAFDAAPCQLPGRAPEPRPDQVGVVAVIDGVAVSLDLFDRAGTLAAYWPGLLAAAELGRAVDRGPDGGTGAGSGRRWVRDAGAETLLRRVAAADRAEGRPLGLGRELHLQGHGVVGSAVVWDDAVVHLGALAA